MKPDRGGCLVTLLMFAMVLTVVVAVIVTGP